MGVCACDCNICLLVQIVLSPKLGKPLKDTIPYSCIAGLGIQDEVDETVLGLVGVAYNKGPRVKTMT